MIIQNYWRIDVMETDCVNCNYYNKPLRFSPCLTCDTWKNLSIDQTRLLINTDMTDTYEDNH